MITTLTLRRPDDWHLHLRDGGVLEAVLPHTSAHFARAVVMPNLLPPVVTVADASAYRQRIIDRIPPSHQFTPLMTVYLTETTDPDDVANGHASGVISAVKLYPAGATTNSDSGVEQIDAVMPVLERMTQAGIPLLVHGEVTDPSVDLFDREAAFIERVLVPLTRNLPELRIVLEHITTQDGVQFVRSQAANVAATITPHHLVWNRNHLFEGGLRPHRYCLPIVKREVHRLALRAAATSADERFFLGTDSAPHVDSAKESSCGCAGVFNVVTTLSCLAHVFEQDSALGNLEAFVSLNGPKFYGLEPNSEIITLTRHAQARACPGEVATPDGPLTVFDPGFPMHWALSECAP